MTTLSKLYRAARTRLTEAGMPDPALDARLLVEHFAQTTLEDIVCRPMTEVGEAASVALNDALSRRIAGEPTHRIIGWREFFGLRLRLSPETLEPRADTETLVDAVLPFVRQRAAQAGVCRILDLGTGTGAIALALLANEDKAVATATDISDGALSTAQANAGRLGLSARFSAIHSDWFSEVAGQFDLIVSNPPYISTDIVATLDAGVRDHDPMAALDGGTDGLDAYRAIASGTTAHLAPDGLIGLEIGFDQAESVVALFEQAGLEAEPVRADLGGNDRVLLLKMRQ